MEDRVEVSTELLKEIYTLAKVDIPDEISDLNLMEALLKLKKTSQTKEKKPQFFMDEENIEAFSDDFSLGNILVVDDIGVVTYQLKVLFTKMGYDVQVAKDIFGALNTFVKSNYIYVIMDLFVSTEQEGFTLLNETKKIITKNNLNTKIIVITASGKTENKVKCLNGGADAFIKKDIGWQDKLVEAIKNFSTKE